MKEKFERFMIGRYGNDNLNRAISICSVILLVISVILMKIQPAAGTIFWIAGLILIVLCYYRTFSRNIAARSAENQKYLTAVYKVAVKKQQAKERAAQKKDYKFFKCPKCGVLNRIPKGKGKIQITCPRCGEQFIRKS